MPVTQMVTIGTERLLINALIIYNCLSVSWVETQRVCLTFSWDETEYYSKRSCVYKLKMISCNSTLCLFPWIFISAKSQANTLSFNSTQTQTIVNNKVNCLWLGSTLWLVLFIWHLPQQHQSNQKFLSQRLSHFGFSIGISLIQSKLVGNY